MNVKALIAEFVGTFALIFVGVGAITGDFINGGQTGLTGIALAHGLTIAVMVAAVGSISGGHFNPAVTVGLFCTKNIDATNALGYVIAQCAGAILAAFLVKICLPADALMAVGMGTPALGAGISAGMGFVTEVILTFFLVFVIYGTAVNKKGMQPAGLFIGLTVTLDIFFGGPITGAAMNPARYIGPALLGGGLNNCWLYWAGPIIGGILGAMTYKHLLLREATAS